MTPPRRRDITELRDCETLRDAIRADYHDAQTFAQHPPRARLGGTTVRSSLLAN